jgi:hypothetical protein
MDPTIEELTDRAKKLRAGRPEWLVTDKNGDLAKFEESLNKIEQALKQLKAAAFGVSAYWFGAGAMLWLAWNYAVVPMAGAPRFHYWPAVAVMALFRYVAASFAGRRESK